MERSSSLLVPFFAAVFFLDLSSLDFSFLVPGLSGGAVVVVVVVVVAAGAVVVVAAGAVVVVVGAVVAAGAAPAAGAAAAPAGVPCANAPLVVMPIANVAAMQ